MIEIEVPARLRRAILQNDVLLVKRIIKNNPTYLENPDFEDRSNTSLHLAAIKGHLEIVKLLLSLGHDSCTPNIDRTGYDSAPGISLNIDGSTALHLAAANSHPDCVDLLCRTFPHTVDWKDNEGRTPLMLAAQNSNPSHAPVTANSSSHIPPPTGRRPRAVSTNSSIASEDIATITILLSYNASVTATDIAGNTALHYASAWGNLKAVRALLAAGTPPLSPNKANFTPIDYSVTKQAAQYFQSLANELETSDQQQQQQPLKLNTAATRPIATPPDESRAGGTRMLGSPMSSPVKSRDVEQRQMQHQRQSSNTSPVRKNFGGLRLVIDTESAEYADMDDVPSTAKRIERPSIEESRAAT
ncbi:ankyrin repeat domain protein, putative [Talaromyces stipitatus ATCC 10500]|uniref:Ankyrin repeat domain protein, putative n=1 Tax=Talaromyces stipitatus (strain ATCC 10500 / CBS 375.48 / QM 6759 / NRRL 1006) TaxID=441959 RepID=B8MMU3_TALSN|nr:ankyrin repeat domain protein, putative [Talaromyces stipitatus ATCC 10500]EED13849.1 ankyrin repeat domain protein, putative [Talaromyces stipitatus ATCC 10500]